MLEARAAAAPAPAPARPRLVTLRNPRRLGPGGSRNVAAASASAPALVFIDSDCAALEGCLERLLAPLGDPRVGAVGGAEALDPAEPLLGRVFHHVLTSRLTTGGIRGGARRTLARYRPRGFCMAVRRDAFERAGGFSDLPLGEDIDLSARIAALGLALVHAPDARVFHRRRRGLMAFARQGFDMGRGRGTLIRLGRDAVEPLYLVPAAALVAAVALGAAAALAPAARLLACAGACVAAFVLAAVAVSAGLALRSLAGAVLAPLAFALHQASYGAGVLAGLALPLEPGTKAPSTNRARR
jgi:hypothetical protein